MAPVVPNSTRWRAMIRRSNYSTAVRIRTAEEKALTLNPVYRFVQAVEFISVYNRAMKLRREQDRTEPGQEPGLELGARGPDQEQDTAEMAVAEKRGKGELK